MLLSHTWGRRPVRLSSTRHYYPEEVNAVRRRHTPPYWLTVEGEHIPLEGEGQVNLACQAVSAYHNYVAYNVPPDDGFTQEMKALDRECQEHMEASSSEDESEVLSEEDLVYEKEFYL